MYMPVGYSLGWFEIKTDKTWELENKIQICDKFVMLDPIILSIWRGVRGIDPNKSEVIVIQELDKLIEKFPYNPKRYTAKNALEMLIQKGLVIRANSSEELFGYLRNFKMIHNGLPDVDREAVARYELKHVIVSFNEPISVSNLQLDIWREADRMRTFEQIYREKFFCMEPSVFLDSVFYLQKECLLFMA